MKIVFLGSGQFGINSLNALNKSSHNLCFIVTQPSQPAGRGRNPRPTPAAKWAKEYSIPFLETANINEQEIIQKIAGFKPDLILVIAFGQKIGPEVIEMAPKGIINVHSSLLPKFRGAAPINWAILRGEKKTGVSIITVVDKMDAGDMLGWVETDIEPNETAGQLHDRLSALAAPLLIDTLDAIVNGTAVYIKQDEKNAISAPKLRKSDGFLDFSETAKALQTKIRGFSPWPGASALYVSKQTSKSIRVTIASVEVMAGANPDHLKPGTLDQNLNVVCGEGLLKITKIKPAGKAVMDFEDFVNGRRTRPCDYFAKIDS